ncbi:tyrosine-type recombinase/integrase [Ruficoccus sp. ZRK36]|uniref:tyrosine-type recombinase/integrase n=1 Tax=Ruficoccus sp. ZRK36 TaxID=2866311 RepID=UPI001C7337B9|nr:tyrosine-type recombinase/integrase [Ruficoccus sp. ZRK36]QYY36862.1 hypothetical protein K0V07_05140 [Ruficoccus sp. ZRK36]
MEDYRRRPRKRATGAPGEPVLQSYNEKARPDLKWRVKYKQEGAWKVRKFKLKKEAQRFHNEKVAEFRNLGVEMANALSEELKREALDAQEVLGGLSLVEAAKHYRAYVQRTSSGEKVTNLVQAFLRHLRDDRGVGPRHLNDVAGRLGRFAEDFGQHHPAAISPTEVADWLGTLKASIKPKGATEREVLEVDLSVQSRRHYRAALHNFFAWCVDNDHCASIPVRGRPPRVREAQSLAIWTPTELARVIQILFDWSPDQTKSKEGKRTGNYPTKVPEKMDILANIVICAFGGLRQSEFERLHWEHIHLAHDIIDLSDITTKNTPSNRHVTIRPTLRAWLEVFFAFESGPCIKPNFPNRLAAFRQHLRDKGMEWKQNVLRHSFASYLMGELQDAAKVAAQMGHVGQGTLYKHYSKPVYRDHATAYWSLTPDSLTLKAVDAI